MEMKELEKVIKGLEQFKSDFKPFCGNNADWKKVDDALALLKGQEAIKPKIDAFGHPYCPKCKILVYETWKFCPHCGQAVKWDG